MCVAVVVLILILISVVFVLFARWRRRKRRCTRQPYDHTVDDTFHPYVVDDAAADKLSCGGSTLENVLCEASCASNGHVSPRHPASPKRAASYRLSVMNGSDVENMMRTHNYGSNADDLQNVGRQPDGSRGPEFVGRSPVVTAKRSLGPTSVDNGDASKGLNNLNKAENYRKKSKFVCDWVSAQFRELRNCLHTN